MTIKDIIRKAMKLPTDKARSYLTGAIRVNPHNADGKKLTKMLQRINDGHSSRPENDQS